MNSLKYLLFFLILFELNCAPAGSAGPSRGSTDIIASLNGDPISGQEWVDFLEVSRVDPGYEIDSRTRERLFREFLLQKLLLQKAVREGLTVQQDQVDEYLDLWIPDASLRDKRTEQAIRNLLTVHAYVRRNAIPSVQVSLNDLLRFYEQNISDFIVDDQLLVLEVLVQSRDRAEYLLDQVRSGDSRLFRQIARQHSEGTTADRGGELGYFVRGQLPKEFERVIFALKAGETSDVFASPRGFHIFMVEERIPGHAQKFYEVRHEIFDRLVAQQERQALKKFMNQILRDASIEVYDLRLKDFLGRNSQE